MTDTRVVIWRHGPNARWHVQPFIYELAIAERVGQRLVDQFGGEAWSLPLKLPETEDTKD